MEIHGKAICFLRIKRQRDKKIEKKTDESETNRHKQAFYPL